MDLYQTIWNNNSIPKKWGCSKLITIWKGPSKGSAEDPATYRGLQIGSTLCKVLIILIINRLKSWYEAQLLDQQQGFRKGRGCTDGLFQIKNIQQIALKSKKQVPLIFIDLTAAFDHINRDWLFKTIQQRLMNSNKLIDLLKTLYSSTSTSMNEDSELILNLEYGKEAQSLPFYLIFI